MKCAITVELAPAAGAPALDPLQAEGVAAILHRTLSQARDAVGPDGARVTIIDRWVGSHPHGAMLSIIVTTPTPALAGDAVRGLADHIIDRTPALAGWRVTNTEVRVGQDAARQRAGQPGAVSDR